MSGRVSMSLVVVMAGWVGWAIAQQIPQLAPPGMELPYVVSPACPGEYCAFGSWLVCDSLQVYGEPNKAGSQVSWLTRDEVIEVRTGLVRVNVPGAVRAIREVWHMKGTSEEVYIPRGDTIFVLFHRGEGWWDVWHKGQIKSLAVFWPWEAWITRAGYEYSGEVLREVENEFWVFFSDDGGRQGWVPGGWPELFFPFDMEPPYRCPERDSSS